MEDTPFDPNNVEWEGRKVTAKDGLLWIGKRILELPAADVCARMYGFFVRRAAFQGNGWSTGETMTTLKLIDTNILPAKGKCLTCADRTDCPMKKMLPVHRQAKKDYGEHYATTHPDVWEECAIDEIEFVGDVITWCPIYYQERWDG